jgi:hypothetical protein
MIDCMPWRMARRQGSTLHSEHLSIVDILMSCIGSVLKDSSLRTDAEQVGDAVDVVTMPVSEQGLVNGGFLLGEHGLQPSSPRGLALARVDEDTLVAAANQVGIGS